MLTVVLLHSFQRSGWLFMMKMICIACLGVKSPSINTRMAENSMAWHSMNN